MYNCTKISPLKHLIRQIKKRKEKKRKEKKRKERQQNILENRMCRKTLFLTWNILQDRLF
jgi:hypothetical protein